MIDLSITTSATKVVLQQTWMVQQGYHDNTEHNYVFAFVLKKNGGKVPGNLL